MSDQRTFSTDTPQDGIDILDYYSSIAGDPGDDTSELLMNWEESWASSDPSTAKPHVTLRMPTSENRECAIVRGAPSPSLTMSPGTPPASDALGNALLYVPTDVGWRSVNIIDWNSESDREHQGMDVGSSDRLDSSRATTGTTLRRKAHIRRASEPLTSRRDDQPLPNTPPRMYSFDSEDELNSAPELETDMPELSPISPPFQFPRTPLGSSHMPESGKRIFVQLLGASGLPQTGVLKRNPKPYAEVVLGIQRFRTPSSEKRTTTPVWNGNFLFESVGETDSLVIRVWSEGACLGSFDCTVKEILRLQTRNHVLAFTLHHSLQPIASGCIHLCIRDLTVPPSPIQQTQTDNIPKTKTYPRHTKFPSSPSIFHLPYPDNTTIFDNGIANMSVVPDKESPTGLSPAPSPPRSPSPRPAANPDIHPRWVGNIIGRTLSITRSSYSWVPTGDITIKAGPVCAGGHCDIYLGELRRDGVDTQVALKQLRVFTNASADMRKRFRREVQFWSKLQHPNVLPFWGCYELDEYRLFMVSPWASNGNSIQYVQKHPEVDRRRILRQTADALAYLHSGAGGEALVHGDLKADNVLISENGDALLADFGLTRYVEKIASISGTPSGLSPHGHIRFSAPELLLPPPGVDPRPTPESDIFAFACFLVQLYSEEMPFTEIKHDVQVLTEIVKGNRPARPLGVAIDRGLDDELWALANQCWRFSAFLRPSMAQIANQLR